LNPCQYTNKLVCSHPAPERDECIVCLGTGIIYYTRTLIQNLEKATMPVCEAHDAMAALDGVIYTETALRNVLNVGTKTDPPQLRNEGIV